MAGKIAGLHDHLEHNLAEFEEILLGKMLIVDVELTRNQCDDDCVSSSFSWMVLVQLAPSQFLLSSKMHG